MSEINRPTALVGVGIFLAPPGREIRPVMTDEGQELLEIITGGRVLFESEEGVREYERGTIFWHIEGEYTVFRTPPEDPYRCISIRFRVPEKRRTVPRVSFWSAEPELDRFVEDAFRLFHDETIDRNFLCEYLHRRVFWEAYIGNRQSRQAGLPKPLARALALLRDASRLDFSVAQLAAKAGVSEPYLYALFSKHLKSSPHQYLLNYRLRLARTRLAGSDDNIKLIAEECGFENLESFYRAFRRASGMPPGEYRRRQQPNS